MPEILIIDDDQELFALLDRYLKTEGFTCHHAADPQTGLAMLENERFEAVVLDVMMPEINGFEVLNRIRRNPGTIDLPVLMLTARGEDIDRIIGLEMGADDYLGKPFNPRELVARIRSILRRSQGRENAAQLHIIRIDNLQINKNALTVTVDNDKRRLSPNEMRLLLDLVTKVGSTVSRDELCLKFFNRPAYPQDRSLDMLVSRLRRKIGPKPDGGERIVAVRGDGYMYITSGS